MAVVANGVVHGLAAVLARLFSGGLDGEFSRWPAYLLRLAIGCVATLEGAQTEKDDTASGGRELILKI
jgi:hypothetical protein